MQAIESLEKRLGEACEGIWNTFVDPRDAYCDSDGTEWNKLGLFAGSRSSTGPMLSTAHQLAEARAECRELALTNEFAINGHENRISFIVGSGHVYRAAARKGHDVAPEKLIVVQEIIDEFIAENCWQHRQQEIVRRRDRDGEVFLRLFMTPKGHTRVRFVEPDQIFTPPALSGDPAASFGIQTLPDDVEDVVGYHVDGAFVEAHEIQHRKANVDFNVKRGVPLFYPVRHNLRRVEKLLRNMCILAEIQTAIALVRKHHGRGKSTVQRFAAGQADQISTDSASGRQTIHQRFGPGTILDVDAGIDYDFPAARIEAGNYVAVLQAELRAIASRLVMPEFMLTSDASNANYASTLVAEGPAMRMFHRLQAEMIVADRQIMRRAVQHAMAAGVLPSDTLSQIQVQVEPPSLVQRDIYKEAQVHRIEHERGILSPQTWSQRRGFDYAQEQANWREHRHVAEPDVSGQS